MAARREPTFHSVGPADDHHRSAPSIHPGQPIKSASHFTRFISGFQAISTLIGVPLALASGYTLYRTNFAPESGCANLRASIVSMLDKNVDPATRRMLVKRDVEAFERNCGGFDPDAQAAFRTLLANDKAVAQAAPAAKPAPKPATVARDIPKDIQRDVPKELPKEASKEPSKDEAKKAEPARDNVKEAAKSELRPAIVEKKSVVAAAEPEAGTPAAPEAAPMSDSRWLDAVRSALVEHPAEAKAAPPKPQPVLASKPGEPVLQPSWTVSTPAPVPVAQGAAAPLPPAIAVNDIQRTLPADPNRPVPPAAIPAAQYTGANGGANGGTNGGSWVAQIPFVGRIIEGSGH